MHIPAIQPHEHGVRTRGGSARACGDGVRTRGGAVHARGRGAHNINRNTVTRDKP